MLTISDDEIDYPDDRPVSPPRSIVDDPRRLNQRTGDSLAVALLTGSQVWCVNCNSPDDFSIRRKSHDEQFNQMQKALDELCEARFSHHPTDLNKDDVIAVYSFEFACWCRATFIRYNIINKDDRINKVPASRNILLSQGRRTTITVKLIDYDFFDRNVLLFNVKGKFSKNQSPFCLDEYPILLEKCRLTGIEPFPDPKAWSAAAISCCKRLIHKQIISLAVKKIENGIKHVTVVYTDPKGKHGNDLATALHVADHARFPADVKATAPPVPDTYPKYQVTKRPQRGQLFSAVVSHVESPDLFYVTRAEKVHELENLQEELDSFYKIADNREQQKISAPYINLPCVALWNDDGCYYRAIINEADIKEKKVLVQFVDYGNRDNVLLQDVFHVDDKFMSVPLLSHVCSLANVKPFNTHNWSDHATQAFRSMIEDSIGTGHLLVRVLGVTDGKLDVSLSKWINDQNPHSVSIADEMISKNIAGRLDSHDDETDVYSQFGDRDFDAYTVMTEMYERRVKACLNIRDQLIEVIVFHVNSPSDFYVQLANEKVRGMFTSMSDKLGRKMDLGGTSLDFLTAAKNQIHVHDWCAVKINDLWCRGKITAKNSIDAEVSYDVLVVDGGYPWKNCKPCEVFKLPVEFQKDSPYAINVQLADVSPAGGSVWLDVAINRMKEFVQDSDYKGNMSILLNAPPPAERTGAPLPVSLVTFVRKIIGPLEPEKQTFLVLNDLMTGDWGVAIGFQRPRGQRCDSDVLNDSSVSQSGPRVCKPRNLELAENTLISRLQSVHLYQIPDEEIQFYAACQLPDSRKFQGLVTHVDEKLNVYFQLSAGDRGQAISLINNKITAAQRDGNLPVMNGNYLEKRACTVFFDFDKTWNRAIIVGISKKKRSHIKVFYIDYGQVEDVVAEHMSSLVVCKDIPPLAIKAELFGVSYTRDKYVKTYDELRTSLVDKICQFKWENAYDDKPMKVSIQRRLTDDEKSDQSVSLNGGNDDELIDVKNWLLNKDLVISETEPESHHLKRTN